MGCAAFSERTKFSFALDLSGRYAKKIVMQPGLFMKYVGNAGNAQQSRDRKGAGRNVRTGQDDESACRPLAYARGSVCARQRISAFCS